MIQCPPWTCGNITCEEDFSVFDAILHCIFIFHLLQVNYALLERSGAGASNDVFFTCSRAHSADISTVKPWNEGEIH